MSDISSDRQDNLAALLRALGMFDGAQPISPAQVLANALTEVTRLREEHAAMEAMLERVEAWHEKRALILKSIPVARVIADFRTMKANRQQQEGRDEQS